MEIYFKNIGPELSTKAQNAIQKKMQKLDRYIQESSYESHMTIESRRESSSKTSPNGWISTIHLDCAGSRYISTATGSASSKAIMNASRDLKTQLKKERARQTSLRQRQGMFWRLIGTN